MQCVAKPLGGHLHPTDPSDTQRAGGRCGLCLAIDTVVIGQCDQINAGGVDALHQRLGAETAVRGGAVHVQVDNHENSPGGPLDATAGLSPIMPAIRSGR